MVHRHFLFKETYFRLSKDQTKEFCNSTFVKPVDREFVSVSECKTFNLAYRKSDRQVSIALKQTYNLQTVKQLIEYYFSTLVIKWLLIPSALSMLFKLGFVNTYRLKNLVKVNNALVHFHAALKTSKSSSLIARLFSWEPFHARSNCKQ